jgi:hypothetical protein
MRVCEIADMSFSDEGKYPRSLLEGIVTLDVAKRVANAQECVFAYRAIGPTSRIDEALSLVRPHATRIVNCDNVRERKSFTEEWTEAARVA